MDTILIVLLIALISSNVWNWFSLRDLKKHNRSKQVITDERYYELKYKIEYITTIVVVVIGVGGFFGYKWFDGLKKDTADKLKNVTDLYDIKFDSIDKKIESKKYTLNDYEAKQENIDKKVENSDKKLSVISNRIDIINKKSIIKQDFYIVDNLKFPATENGNWYARFYYKNLKTIGGDSLPFFKKSPFLIAVPENQFELTIKYIGREYFDIETYNRLGDDDTVKFSLMISQK